MGGDAKGLEQQVHPPEEDEAQEPCCDVKDGTMPVVRLSLCTMTLKMVPMMLPSAGLGSASITRGRQDAAPNECL